MSRSSVAVLLVAALLGASCKKKDKGTTPAPSLSPDAATSLAASAAETAATSAAPPTVATAPAAPAGSPPPDGKYERVIVDGVTVPMINVMDKGATVLVDTDGKKPRTWEEQYKRKRSTLLTGQYDLHKTNANKNDTFEDDPIDKEGLWVIDAKGNITQH
jgi:hypothetical protein